MSNRKHAIVTGGSRGIGRACALKLGDMGYNVVVNYCHDEAAEKAAAVVADLEAKGVEAIAVQADVSKFECCKYLIETACERFGDTIDVLVNNAGIYFAGMHTDLSWEEHESMIATNLTSQVALCYLALPHMVERDTCLVNVASVGGMSPVAASTTYGATKAGSIGLTQCLALDYADKGVRVNVICPGTTLTDMLICDDPEWLEGIAQAIPMKRLGKPEELGEALEYIVSAKYLTGQIISPNGGCAM